MKSFCVNVVDVSSGKEIYRERRQAKTTADAWHLFMLKHIEYWDNEVRIRPCHEKAYNCNKCYKQ